MDRITRRDTLGLGIGAGVGALGLGAAPAHAAIPVADIAPFKIPVENGATLRVLRPTKFVDPDETIFRENTQAFTKATGINVRVDFVGWEDLRPQTAVTANTGAGPDIVLGWPNDPHLYADRLVDMGDLADYLGRKYGGWYALPEKYGKKWGTNQWIALPMGGSSGPTVYRTSWVKEAGYDKIPSDLGQFLDLARKLKKINHPVGFSLGNAVGDANGFANWMLWAHGGYMVDEQGVPALKRPETIEALKYGKALYAEMIPGTLSWNDASNNKAFTAEDISLTFNGVSIYYVLKNDPKTAAIAADTDHAPQPFGKAGRTPASALILNAMIFKHTKYPNAAKDYLRFMMEREQYDKWLTGCLGYWSQPLKAYAQSAIWSSDPKIAVYRDGCSNEYWEGYKGPINAAAGAVSANYVIVHMFAAVASGQATPEEAVAEAERQVRRYYKTS
jgi:multiple sugar transport system substrate-binding protein